MNENTRDLAEKIALLLRGESGDNSILRSSLEKINQRLDNIESRISNPASRISNPVIHPSREKFAVAEAVVPDKMENFEEEKPCIFEPNGKPCDHCSMCSSRGF